MSSTTTEFDLYTDAQQVVLGYLPLLSAPLSLAGSLAIMYVIVTDNSNKIEVYQRLMLGMSTMDFLSSFGLVFLGSWAMPKDTSYVVGARGSVESCEAAGFLVNFIFGTMWYSFFLALYFLLLLRFEWSKKRISKCFEPFAHFVSISVPLANNI
jgi:hypothetical protein